MLVTASDCRKELEPDDKETEEKACVEKFPSEIVNFTPYENNPVITDTGNDWVGIL